jgi:hypothetical protein
MSAGLPQIKFSPLNSDDILADLLSVVTVTC